MGDFDLVQAKLTALTSTLDRLDKDYADGTVSETFYYKRRISMVRDCELAIKEVKSILDQNDATELSSVLDKISSGAPESEVEQDLKKAQEAGSSKGWGDAVLHAITEHKGSIISAAVSAALRVAQLFL